MLTHFILRLFALLIFLKVNPFLAYTINVLFDATDCTYSMRKWMDKFRCTTQNLPNIKKVLSECRLECDGEDYQRADKIMDTIMNYVALCFFGKWKLTQNSIGFQFYKILWCLFYFRLIGVILFATTNERKFLMYFPNFFEFFYIYFAFLVMINSQNFAKTPFGILVSVVLVYEKVLHEKYLHTSS